MLKENIKNTLLCLGQNLFPHTSLTFYVRKYFPKRFKNIVHNIPEPGGKYLT